MCVLFVDEDCACRTIRVMINGQEAELTIIDIPYIEMSVSLKKNSIFQNVRGSGGTDVVSFYGLAYGIKQYKTKSCNIIWQEGKKCYYIRFETVFS